MPYCGEKTLSTTVEDVKVGKLLPCRSWGCETCAPDRQRALIAQGIAGNANRLVTLTSRRRDGITAVQAAKDLVRAWRLIRRTLERTQPRSRIEFLAIFEQTKLGWPHLHILIRSNFIDQHWLSSQMARMTDSPIVHITAIRSRRGAAAYVAKYTAKGCHKFGTCKRYWASKAWEVKKWTKQTHGRTWDRQDMTLTAWCQMWRGFGWSVTILSHKRAEARAPP